MATCPSCGHENQEGARFCAKCGTALAPPTATAPPVAPAAPPAAPPAQPPHGPPPPAAYPPPTYGQPYAQPYGQPYGQPYYGPMAGERNAVLALVLSFIITGLGQIYNRENSKGVMLLVLAVILWVFNAFFFWLCIGLVLSLALWIYGMYDAYTRAEEYNRMLRATGRPPW